MNKIRKIYVLDTSVVIEDPDVFSKFSDVDIIIPTAVVKEIDGLKKNPKRDETRAMAARRVTRTLDRLGSDQDISAGARTSAGSIVKICSRFTVIDDLASAADNRIVGTAIKLKEESDSGYEIILVSTDGNMRNIARAYRIRAENYPFHLDPSLNRPNERLLSDRTIDRHKNVPTISGSKNTTSERLGVFLLVVISILLFFLLNPR